MGLFFCTKTAPERLLLRGLSLATSVIPSIGVSPDLCRFLGDQENYPTLFRSLAEL